jgi:hypothetical protein
MRSSKLARCGAIVFSSLFTTGRLGRTALRLSASTASRLEESGIGRVCTTRGKESRKTACEMSDFRSAFSSRSDDLLHPL